MSTTTRYGYVLHMWTGLFPESARTGLPTLFRTKRAALCYVARCPSWGRSAVTVYACKVRQNGSNGKPDYIIGNQVANGSEA